MQHPLGIEAGNATAGLMAIVAEELSAHTELQKVFESFYQAMDEVRGKD